MPSDRNKRPRGPGARFAPSEKPKNFKAAVSRLLKELSIFKVLILFSLILALFSSILSIYAPNKLSELTDEISKGLVVNSKNMEEITKEVTSKLDNETITKTLSEVLLNNLSNEDILSIVQSYNMPFYPSYTSEEDLRKNAFGIVLSLPYEQRRELLKDSIYNGITVTTNDKLIILELIEKMQTEASETNADFLKVELPDSIVKIIFGDSKISGKTITAKDKYEFLKVLADLDMENTDVNALYLKIEEMPESIKEVIKPVMNIDAIKKITIFLIVLYVISALFTYSQSIIMTIVSNKFANKLRAKISHKINKLPLKYFDKHQSGDILSRVTNDVDTIAQSMNQALATLVSNLTLFLGSIVMMFYTNYIMALTAIFASIFGFVGMGLLLKKSQNYFVMRQNQLGDLNSHIEEIYSGLNVVKVYNGKRKADEEFDKLNEKLCYSNKKSQFISGIMHPLMGFIGNFGYVAVCIVGALLASNGNISFGVIVAFMTYVRLFTNPLSQIAQSMTSLQSTAAASERVFDFVDSNEMTDEKDITTSLKSEEVKGNIEFKNVKFRYDDSDHDTIKGFTASAKAGEKIAIVGPTGAGKTTMVNLLMKFYEISGGDILIDGVSTKSLTRENIHLLFTMVLQDTWLFEGTLKENIIYNRENITDEDVKEVCKKVGLDHFVKTLPDGINTILSENDSVSSGQRQLLTIARAMLDKSPFLILDEATSNVDTRTEELVQKAMDKLAEGRTSFIIAHRLSTIKNADLILVMNEGNIIEQGNHEDLMNQNGFYAKLYNSQFEM